MSGNAAALGIRVREIHRIKQFSEAGVPDRQAFDDRRRQRSREFDAAERIRRNLLRRKPLRLHHDELIADPLVDARLQLPAEDSMHMGMDD